MPRPEEIQNIIEKVVGDVLTAALPGLRIEMVRRVAAELQALAPASDASPTDILNAVLTTLQEATSQADILRYLLEGNARFAGRVALFVVKAGAINGWQGIGFEDNEIIKNIGLNTSAGLVDRAIQSRVPVAGPTAQFDPGFMSTVATPVEGNCLVLPLVVKEKVAALLYADAGTAPGGQLDVSALSTITRWAALWLEFTALRRAGGTAPQEEAPQGVAVAAAAAMVPSASAAPVLSAEETELHRKAKRFAKLLVEEIKLYNQPKVVEGKLNRDLYERLKQDIEKSRATYDKRYGESTVASAGYFNQELVRVLADNDASLMGASFPGV